MDVMEYDYSDTEPTTYGYLNEDKTPAETLAENPDATWSGIELYRAVADAMAAIGADKQCKHRIRNAQLRAGRIRNHRSKRGRQYRYFC